MSTAKNMKPKRLSPLLVMSCFSTLYSTHTCTILMLTSTKCTIRPGLAKNQLNAKCPKESINLSLSCLFIIYLGYSFNFKKKKLQSFLCNDTFAENKLCRFCSFFFLNQIFNQSSKLNLLLWSVHNYYAWGCQIIKQIVPKTIKNILF